MKLNDKVAIITGAGSGIGRSLAQRFAANGARAVICTDQNGERAEETARLIGSQASAETLDVADEAAINDIVARVEKQYGGIDVFVSNAGYGRNGGLEMPTVEWERMMSVHTWSHLAAARAVLPGMLARGSGYLLSTSSAAGLLSQFDSGAYAVSKNAAVALAEWLSINYVERGIGVSVLCPQAVRTNVLHFMEDQNVLVDVAQAAGDGILEPEVVADLCIEAMADGRFLVLPHPEVQTYFQRKATDYDRWLTGMRRTRKKFLEAKAG